MSDDHATLAMPLPSSTDAARREHAAEAGGGIEPENCGISAWPEKFQPPIASGAASAATKVAPRMGRMMTERAQAARP